MTDRHSITEARRNLPALVREAESGRAVQLTRRGEPVAILVGCKQFERLAVRRRSFSEAYRDFLENTDLSGLALDPDELLDGVRDTTTGRVVPL